MTEVRMKQQGLTELLRDPHVAEELGKVAERVKARVRAPKKFQLIARHGVAESGRRQAYAQVIMKGSGAVAVEFGSRNGPPKAPLRRALHETV